MFISIKDLSKSFINEEGASIKALADICFDVKENEFVCILGRSGCGKSTLLRIVAGLDRPSGGGVFMEGEPIVKPHPERGMVFQDPRLFMWRTVAKNIEFGLEIKGVRAEERRIKAQRYIDLMGLSEFANSYPHELSGGMKQRVSIARMLINEPRVMLMDEPFGALDALTRTRLQEDLLTLMEKEKRTTLFVTHSVDESIFLADKILVFSEKAGRIKAILEPGIPKPRDRHSSEMLELKKEVTSLL